jgi:hypothetical protein
MARRSVFIACEPYEQDLSEVDELCTFLGKHDFITYFPAGSKGRGDFYPPLEDAIEKCDAYVTVAGQGLDGSTWLNKILQYAFILHKYRTVSTPRLFGLHIKGYDVPPISQNIPLEWLRPDTFHLLLEDLPRDWRFDELAKDFDWKLIVTNRYRLPHAYSLEDLPQFRRFQAANPGKDLNGLKSLVMFGQAIHWLSFFDVIWPDFEHKDYVRVEVAYIVANDPEDDKYPRAMYDQIAGAIAVFWRVQLDDLYPEGKWSVNVRDDAEITVEATITERHRN